MQVTREDKSPTKILLKVKADAADLEPIRQHTLTHFKAMKVPGFRAGKAPLNVIEQHVNQQALSDEFMQHALNDLYGEAARAENIRPIANPNVQLKKFVPYTLLEFEAEVDVLSPIKLPNYKTIKLAVKKPEVTLKDVDEVIKSLQTRFAERTEVSRTAKNGDEVTISFDGYDKVGQPIAGAGGQDYPLVLGSGSFIPGFESNIVGLKAGDKKDFDITFPADYGATQLQNQEVLFKIKVIKVAEMVEPKIDDNFAAKAGPFKTVKELKADVKKNLIAERQNQATINHQNELIKKIGDRTEIEVPKVLVEEEVNRLEESEKRDLTYRGQTWQEHLQAEGITADQHRDRHRAQAQERVKFGLLLNEIAEKEGITVTPEEIELRLQLLKGQYTDPQMQAELDKPENVREIESRLITEKTIDKLVGYATK